MDGPGAAFEVRGSLAVEEGRGLLHYEMPLPAPVDVVWSALTDPARLADWYGRVDGDLHVGGRYHAVLVPSGWEGDGHVLACEPGHGFRMESAEPGEPVTVDDVSLVDDGDGRSRILLERVRPSADLLAAYGAGTQLHLENLAAHLAGRGPVDVERYWSEVHPRYEAMAAAL